MGALAFPGRVLMARLPHGRLTKMVATVAVATVIVGGASLIPGATTTPTSPSGVDWWVAANGNDTTCAANPNNQSFPCLTLNKAYQLASPGDTVEIAGGSYSGQTMNYDSSKSSSTDVTFVVASGADVEISGMTSYASHYTLDGSDGTFHIVGPYIPTTRSSPEPSDVTFEHMDLRGDQTTQNWGDDFTYTDVDMGGHCQPDDGSEEDAFSMQGGYNPGDGQGAYSRANNLIIQDSRIGDICQFSNAQGIAHTDCLQVSGVDGVIFRRNKLHYCGVQGFYTNNFPQAPSDILVENNWFGPNVEPGDNGAGRALAIDNTTGPITVRYNSFSAYGGTHMGIQSSTGTILVYGNTGTQGSGCLQGTYSYNVWVDVTCGATDVQADPGFVNDNSSATFDLHLASNSSPACGAGDQANYPADDLDGDTRPLNSTVEAGADELAGC